MGKEKYKLITINLYLVIPQQKKFFGPNMQLVKEGFLRFNKAGRGSVEWE
jgi:hypothetical protein